MRPIVIAGLLGVFVLTGCSTAPAPDPVGETPEVTVAATCAQYGNVMTVLFNASISQSQGRSTQQELDGARRLAHSMLEYTTVEAGTELESIVERLRAVDPADLNTGDGSGEWAKANNDLGDACREAGSDVDTVAWTGG